MRRTRCATAVLVTCALSVSALEAQRRTPRDVTIPGTDIAVRAGWLVQQSDGCRFSVPLDWKPAPSHDTFDGPEGSTLLVRRLQFSSWTAHIALIRSRLGSEWTVRDSTTQRVWVEMRGSEVMEDYVETRLDDGSCSAVLRYSAPDLSRDTAQQIIGSLAPVRAR